VFRANLNPPQGSEQGGTRPVIVVTRNSINEFSPVIIIVPTTDSSNIKKQYPQNVNLKKGAGGLTMDSTVLCGQMRAISKERLVEFLGHLPDEDLGMVDEAMLIALALDENSRP